MKPIQTELNSRPLREMAIQCKLSIGAVDDPLEAEADAMADTVIRMPEQNFIQRKCSQCEEEEKLQRKPLNSFIQRKESFTGDAVTNQINSSRGNGNNIDSNTRSFMQSRFEADFSNIRIHTDQQSVQMNRELNARAFTVGNDIYFNEEQYNPGTNEGKHLLAHELTHTIQQSNSSMVQRQAAPPAAPPVVNGGLTDPMLEQIARRLRAAMEGWGTDEEAIYSAFSGRTQEQVNAIERKYNSLYNRSLMADLQDELNEDEMRHLAIFSPSAVEGHPNGFAEMAARQLKNAMDGWGTDESSIFNVLTGRTEAERTAIREAYMNLTHRDLNADLADELSGSDHTTAMRLLNQGLLQPEDELYLAMEGLGTDEDTIFRILDALQGDNSAIEAMERSYRTKYGDLIADLRGDLNSGEYSRAMSILRPVLQDAAFEDCAPGVIQDLRAIIPVGIQKVDHAIVVLSKGLSGMNAAELAQFRRFYDPGNAGGIDQRFVDDVLRNFRLIRQQFENDLTAECEDTGGLCTGSRLFYTYGSNIHVCPPFATANPTRQARDFVHELGHNGMMAFDRPYYSATSTEYAALTPRGSIFQQLPVLGPLIGAFVRGDTLYHPDAYSWFAFEVP